MWVIYLSFLIDLFCEAHDVRYNCEVSQIVLEDKMQQGGLSIRKWSKSFPLHTFTEKWEPPEVSLPLRNSHDGAI